MASAEKPGKYAGVARLSDTASPLLSPGLMPRRFQIGSGGVIFHVMNRGAHRARLFFDPDDYRCFLRAMSEALKKIEMRILCYAIMPNHWHLVLWPRGDHDLSNFMRRLTGTHAQWWRLARRSSGTGVVYQGRFRAIPVQTGEHFLTVCRYVERNPSRANLVERASDWEWSSAWTRSAEGRPPLTDWPVDRPPDWTRWLEGELEFDAFEGLRAVIQKSVPYGTTEWTDDIAARLRLQGKVAGPGRPRNVQWTDTGVAEIEIRPGRGAGGGACAVGTAGDHRSDCPT
jgi:putative transposase